MHCCHQARAIETEATNCALVYARMPEPLQIETSRLVLRPPVLDDLDTWTAMMEDEETARFIGGAVPRAVSWRALMTMIGCWHAHGFAMFSVIEKSTGRWVGRLGPWQPEGWPGS